MALIEYLWLSLALDQLREEENYSEELEETILDMLESLWLELTDDERALVEARDNK